MSDDSGKLARDVLSDVTVFMKYSRYLPELKRRETWKELVTRNMEMHIRKYPELENEITQVYNEFVMTKKVLPSMRSLQFAGKPIEVNPSRLYNCSFMHVNHLDAFSETMFLLLSGTGVGVSVQQHHVDQLPALMGTEQLEGKERPRRYLVGDSIEGWADAVKVLVEAWFKGKKPIEFDYSDIRAKGEQLITSGGKAPGAGPLRECITQVTNILEAAIQTRGRGTKLKPIEVHDIICHLADAVLAGGIRRAALISLFSFEDEEMLTSKTGAWWETNPQRGRANNSVVLVRDKLQESDFFRIWKKVEDSGAGEPGVFLTNDAELGTNPCAEISLKSNQFCNLCEINAGDIIDQADFEARTKAAAFIGTLQAGYTGFHYLRSVWRKNQEKDALLGISMTGIASGVVMNLDLKAGAKAAVEENKRVAELIGISPAARVTTTKPSGTSSLVLGTSSGVHAWHNDYYLRRIRVGKNEAIYRYLSIFHPELVEDEHFNPTTTAVIGVPQKAPEGATLRTESPIETLERVKALQKNWIKPGHNKGKNTHNVSCTISVKPNEWEEVGNWMWKNKEHYSGISVLPFSDHTYIQAPFEDITKEKYEELVSKVHSIDLSQVIEETNNTKLQDELACVSGGCEIV